MIYYIRTTDNPVQWAKERAKETNDCYSSWTSSTYQQEALKYGWFKLYQAQFDSEPDSFMDTANINAIKELLKDFEADYVSLDGEYDIDIHPYGFSGESEFNEDLVTACQDINNSLAHYPCLDDDSFQKLVHEYWTELIEDELVYWAEDDPIVFIVANARKKYSQGDHEFYHKELPKIILDYRNHECLMEYAEEVREESKDLCNELALNYSGLLGINPYTVTDVIVPVEVWNTILHVLHLEPEVIKPKGK